MADSIQFPTLTDERAQRVVASEAAHMSSWMESMQEQFGPSFGVHIAKFGNAVALAAQGLHDNSIFNRVIGLTTRDEKYLKDILAFYATYRVPYRIDRYLHGERAAYFLHFGDEQHHRDNQRTGQEKEQQSPPRTASFLAQFRQDCLSVCSIEYSRWLRW